MTGMRDAPLTPAELIALNRIDGLTVSDLRRAIPDHCFELHPFRSWLALIRSLFLIGTFQWLIYVVGSRPDLTQTLRVMLFIPLWFALACGFVGLFVLGHDCGHRSFSPAPLLNDVVGHLCMAPLLTGFHSWRIAHNHHHIHTQIRGDDTDWPEGMVTYPEFQRLTLSGRFRTAAGFGSPLGVLLGFWSGVLRRLAPKLAYPQLRLTKGDRRRVLASNASMILVLGTLTSALLVNGGGPALLIHFIAPATLAAAIGSLLTLLHHTSEHTLVFDRGEWTPMRGQVLSTFQVRFPRLLEWLWLDINIHLPHHLAPQIPWYQLRAAGAALQSAYPAYYQERRFQWKHLRLIWSRPLLAHNPSDHFYEPTGWPHR